MKSHFGVLALVILLGACAATAPSSTPTPTPTPTPTATATATVAPGAGNADLACLLPSNCVTSQGSGGLVPLRYAGTPAQALDLLRATLATFPEATVVRAEPLALALIFTTPAGFKDQVDFKIDVQDQRIDFRSRSLFGLFDFGKNRARMQEIATRFEQQRRR
jgi:uncharacterized protein (DUF1499 family)